MSARLLHRSLDDAVDDVFLDPLPCATLASSQSFLFITGSVKPAAYLAAIQRRPAPAVGSFDLSTVSLVLYSCALNSFSASCHSSTHSAAAAVASSLIGKLASFRLRFILVSVLLRGHNSLLLLPSPPPTQPSQHCFNCVTVAVPKEIALSTN